MSEVNLQKKKLKENENEKIVKYGVVQCKKLNLRSEPNLYSNVLSILDLGTKLEVLNDKQNKTTDFLKVKVNDTVGYCCKSFLKLEEKICKKNVTENTEDESVKEINKDEAEDSDE